MEFVKEPKKPGILIVDDEPELLLSLKRPLKTKYEVFTNDNSMEVMAQLNSHPVDCILLDIRMPGISGIELLKEIKFAYPHIPVLIMTGHGNEDDTITTLKYGASGYLKKPIDIYVLFDEIARVTQEGSKTDDSNSPAKILLVDDEVEVLLSIKRALSNYPYIIHSASSAHDALLAMKTDNYDIIIADLQMPVMSGLEFLEHAKKISSTFIPIILTGVSTQELAIDAIKHGVFDYIKKPFDLRELISAIERCIHKLEMNRQIYQKNRELSAKEKMLENLNNEIILQKNYLENIVGTISNILIITDEHGTIERVNDAALKLLGYTAEELVNQPFNKIICINDYDFFISNLQVEHSISNIEAEYHAKNGDKLTVLYSATLIRNQSGSIEGFVFVAQDVSARKMIEKELHQLSYYDALTKLPNQLYFEMQTKQVLAKTSENGTFPALLYIDLDGFKSVNDRLGHPIGDKLLREVARRLESCFRANDCVARIGSDEFIACLSAIKEKSDAGIVAQRLINLINRPFFIDNNEISVGTSIGIALFSESDKDYEQLFKNADIALYKAKHAGRNQFQYFTKQLNHEYGRQLDIENALRFALSRNEFHMVYQPIYELSSKKIISIEALLRWDSSEISTTSPDDFIPIAEYIGLILPISEWVLESTLKQFAEWKLKYHSNFHISINISVCQLNNDNDLIERLQKACRKYNIAPSDIELELTETAIMSNPKHAEAILLELSELGFLISLDDFGKGFSSLSLLSRLPVSILKIDRQFIGQLPDSKDEFIVKSVLSLSKSLKLDVVAEGIETGQQWEYLVKNHCYSGQGYYLSKPVRPDEIEVLLQKNLA